MTVVVLEVLDDGAQGLLSPTAHSLQRQGTIGVVRKLRLDVELSAHRRGSRRNATTRRQGCEAVEREVAMQVVTSLARPLVQLFRGQAPRRLASHFDREELDRRGVAAGVENIQLEAGMARAHLLGSLLRIVNRRREASRETHVYGRQALLGGTLEHLEVTARGDGACRVMEIGVLAQPLIELVRLLRAPEVIFAFSVGSHVREVNHLHAETLDDGRGKVGAGINNNVARPTLMERPCHAHYILRSARSSRGRLHLVLFNVVVYVGLVLAGTVLGVMIAHPHPRSWV